MYHGEVQVSEDNLKDFLKTAETLQVRGLAENNASAVTVTAANEDLGEEERMMLRRRRLMRRRTNNDSSNLDDDEAIDATTTATSSRDQCQKTSSVSCSCSRI